MPKYFCDYCECFLTHDSMSVRKAHNAGRIHMQKVRDYYQGISQEVAQNVIDSITQRHEAPPQLPSVPGMLPPPPSSYLAPQPFRFATPNQAVAPMPLPGQQPLLPPMMMQGMPPMGPNGPMMMPQFNQQGQPMALPQQQHAYRT